MRSNGASPPEGDSGPARQSDDSQTLDDRDQTLSDRDQTLSDRDQQASDEDQAASDENQAASDPGREDGVDSASHAHASAIRAGTTQERGAVGSLREDTAMERDLAAQERDELAAQRDHDADIADKRALDLDGTDGLWDRHTLRGQELRAREAEGRTRAALARVRAARDRRQAARDRELGARDREESKQDRASAGTDELTGARRRGVGLEELEREIARARRMGENLVVAYVDVDGLKQINDEHGHSAGDRLLREAAEGLRHRMRTYDLLVRLGGDELLCVLSGISLDEVRRRFQDLGSERPGGSTVSIGVSELSDGEGAQDLIDRADHSLLRARGR